jgi:hypothetical protein
MKEIIALCTALLFAVLQSGLEQQIEHESIRNDLMMRSTRLFLEARRTELQSPAAVNLIAPITGTINE